MQCETQYKLYRYVLKCFASTIIIFLYFFIKRVPLCSIEAIVKHSCIAMF